MGKPSSVPWKLSGCARAFRGRAGRVDEARSLLVDIRREQPNLSFAWIGANVPYQTPELMERYLQGFRKAGLDGVSTGGVAYVPQEPLGEHGRSESMVSNDHHEPTRLGCVAHHPPMPWGGETVF